MRVTFKNKSFEIERTTVKQFRRPLRQFKGFTVPKGAKTFDQLTYVFRDFLFEDNSILNYPEGYRKTTIKRSSRLMYEIFQQRFMFFLFSDESNSVIKYRSDTSVASSNFREYQTSQMFSNKFIKQFGSKERGTEYQVEFLINDTMRRILSSIFKVSVKQIPNAPLEEYIFLLVEIFIMLGADPENMEIFQNKLSN